MRRRKMWFRISPSPPKQNAPQWGAFCFGRDGILIWTLSISRSEIDILRQGYAENRFTPYDAAKCGSESLPSSFRRTSSLRTPVALPQNTPLPPAFRPVGAIFILRHFRATSHRGRHESSPGSASLGAPSAGSFRRSASLASAALNAAHSS